MASKGITSGQTFTAADGGIKVTVLRVGNSREKARFKVENLKAEKVSYTVTVKRKSGAEPDRIPYKTDDQNGDGQYELSADETVGVEITRDPEATQPHWVSECERRPTTNSVFDLLVVGAERNGSWPIGYAKGSFNDGDWKFMPEDPQHTRVVAWLEGTVASNHELYNVPKDKIKFS